MNLFFSNRYRPQKLGVAILLLLGLCGYANINGNRYSDEKAVILEECLQLPFSCVDKLLVMRAQIRQLGNGSYIAYPRIRGNYRLEYPLPIFDDLVDLQHGYVVDILGAYSLEGTFVIVKFQRDNWIRLVKYGVSILGLLLTAILLCRRYRFSGKWSIPLVHR